jgi:hypothetical protein
MMTAYYLDQVFRNPLFMLQTSAGGEACFWHATFLSCLFAGLLVLTQLMSKSGLPGCFVQTILCLACA